MRRTKTECQCAIKIWVDTEQKIASFHALEDQECLCFYRPEHVTAYCFSLIKADFRFM